MLNTSRTKRLCSRSNFFSKIIEADFNDITSFNYRDVVVKTTSLILKNEIRQIIKKCKFDNVSNWNEISNRKNRSCETVLKLLTKQIHMIWNMSKDKITTLLSMNVIEAYDHVSRERLLHNLKKRRISTWIVAWTNNFMQDKRINLIVKTKQTIMNNVNVNISQKSLMLLILYLFYNASLLKLLE